MDSGRLQLFLLIATVLLGATAGTFLRGLWRSRSAANAQVHAYARAAALPSRYQREPRWYQRRGRQVSAFLGIAALGTWVAAWLANAHLPIPSNADLTWYSVAFLLAAFGTLFVRAIGIALLVVTITVWLSVGAALATDTGISDPNRTLPLEIYRGPAPGPQNVRTVETTVLFRFVAQPLSFQTGEAARPRGLLPEMGVKIMNTLPGFTIRTPRIEDIQPKEGGTVVLALSTSDLLVRHHEP